mmetsp:Transcript_123975/g.246858  ORF Transcript_123975/g.246858 Transcript_123975/m.246858 type:complete len:95 (-) Transcript_123975:1358-1642(-)
MRLLAADPSLSCTQQRQDSGVNPCSTSEHKLQQLLGSLPKVLRGAWVAASPKCTSFRATPEMHVLFSGNSNTISTVKDCLLKFLRRQDTTSPAG